MPLWMCSSSVSWGRRTIQARTVAEPTTAQSGLPSALLSFTHAYSRSTHKTHTQTRNAEYGVGALAEKGVCIVNNAAVHAVGATREQMAEVLRSEWDELERRRV